MTMCAKIRFLSVLVVFAVAALAYPNADHHNDSSEEHHHEGGHNHGKGYKHEKNNGHHHHHGGMDVKFNPDSPFVKVKNLTESLYNEIFVIASGDNYASPELPNDVHVNARAIVLWSQKLRRMRSSFYHVFFNLTTTYALNGRVPEDKQTMIDLINDLVAQVKNRNFGFETFKSNVTDSFIMRGKYFKSGATPQEKAEAYDKWLYDPFVGAAAMNKLFHHAAWLNDKPAYKLLRAMITYGGKDEEKLQNVYTTVVAKTVEKICPAHEPLKAAYAFYKNLIEKLSEDASLMISLYDSPEMVPGAMIDKPF